MDVYVFVHAYCWLTLGSPAAQPAGLFLVECATWIRTQAYRCLSCEIAAIPIIAISVAIFALFSTDLEVVLDAISVALQFEIAERFRFAI